MSSLRSDALYIIEESIKQVLPERAVEDALLSEDFAARSRVGRIVIAAIGKAAWRMAKAAADFLRPLKASSLYGAVVTKYGHSMGEIEGLDIFEAGHPLPDENTIRGTSALLEKVKGLSPDDTVLFLVSGGGSALFEKPMGISLEDLVSITDQLLARGADIIEMNTIRKRLSAVKGGRFAELCAPAHVYSVVLSDVLGDRLESIASGPAYPDSSTSDEALRLASKYRLTANADLRDILKKETPKSLNNVTTVVTGSVTALCAAAERSARSLGYQPLLLTTTLNCEAREAGAFLSAMAREISYSGKPLNGPCAVILGGETVVHLKGKGKGGRNQELALSAARGIAGLPDIVIASAGSDGTDGPTDAAGGIVDGNTVSAIAEKGLDIEKFLDDNDSYNALLSVDSLVVTGPTGTNVNDLTILLKGRGPLTPVPPPVGGGV